MATDQLEALLAVSLGDPAGIGPELLTEAWLRREELNLPPFMVAGAPGLMAQAATRRGCSIRIAEVFHPAEALDSFSHSLPVLAGIDGDYRPGEPDTDSAELALASLEEATRLALAGEVAAVVTAPVSKANLAVIGFPFPGQTEFVADRCGVAAQDAVMLLAGPNLKTVPLTVHVALAAVPALLTADLIVRRGQILASALRNDFGIDHPRIAIAALNPHAGEAGLMGDEEQRVIMPAIASLRAAGIDASGPHPADAMFTPRARQTYDAALCMYHDQALVPLKALDFDDGVNITLGLPIVRTSPDHGTAFGIAGNGQAHPGAMIAALRLAASCAARRQGRYID